MVGGLVSLLALSKGFESPNSAKQYAKLINRVEIANNLPKNILMRLLQQESDFDKNAHNVSSGAKGIAQIIPRWHPDIANPFDPNESITYAGGYLRELYDHFGHWDVALAAYNWGWGNVTKVLGLYGADAFIHLPLETQNYVTEILRDI